VERVINLRTGLEIGLYKRSRNERRNMRKESYYFRCCQCGVLLDSEFDCLKHAETFNHFEFKDPYGKVYKPTEDLKRK